MSVCDLFSRALSEFLAIGMTYEQFYDDDPWLVVNYKKADRIRRERSNFNAYLQGAYVYEAIVRCAPILNAFNSKPKLDPWLDKPYDLFSNDQDNTIHEDKISKKEQAGINFMNSFMIAHNHSLAEKSKKEQNTI